MAEVEQQVKYFQQALSNIVKLQNNLPEGVALAADALRERPRNGAREGERERERDADTTNRRNRYLQVNEATLVQKVLFQYKL